MGKTNASCSVTVVEATEIETLRLVIRVTPILQWRFERLLKNILIHLIR